MSSDRLAQIEAVLANVAESQQRSSERMDRIEAAQERNTEAISRLEAAQERTQQQANETEQTADDNAQYLGETRAMLEQAIHGFRADIQAVVAVFSQTITAIREESNQRHDEHEQRHAELEARHAEHDQRFNTLLAEARADRQEIRESRVAWEAEHREWSQRFDEQVARMDERAAANEAEHNAFRQNIQTLLAEIARIWNRLTA